MKENLLLQLYPVKETQPLPWASKYWLVKSIDRGGTSPAPSSDFYHTQRFIPRSFYKAISKIVQFNE